MLGSPGQVHSGIPLAPPLNWLDGHPHTATYSSLRSGASDTSSDIMRALASSLWSLFHVWHTGDGEKV